MTLICSTPGNAGDAGTISRFEGSNLPIPQDPKCYLAEFEDAVGKPTLNSEFFGYTACLC